MKEKSNVSAVGTRIRYAESYSTRIVVLPVGYDCSTFWSELRLAPWLVLLFNFGIKFSMVGRILEALFLKKAEEGASALQDLQLTLWYQEIILLNGTLGDSFSLPSNLTLINEESRESKWGSNSREPFSVRDVRTKSRRFEGCPVVTSVSFQLSGSDHKR